MRNLRNLLFYIITIGGFAAVIFGVILSGKPLESEKVTAFKPEATASTWQQFTETYYHNLTHPLAILLLQIVTIIVVARIFGFFCKKIGQPSVICEIIAVIFLVP